MWLQINKLSFLICFEKFISPPAKIRIFNAFFVVEIFSLTAGFQENTGELLE